MAIEKELVAGISATIDGDGNLTLIKMVSLRLLIIEVPLPVTITLPAQAVRALHNLLRRQVVRELTSYRHEN